VTRYIETFFRHKVLLLTPLVLTLLVSVWYVTKQPTTFTSSSSVWFDTPVPGPAYFDSNGQAPPPAQQAQTLLTQLLTTNDFLVNTAKRGPFADAMGKGDAAAQENVVAKLGSSVLSFPLGPQVLRIQASDRDPKVATANVQAVLDEYFAQVQALRVGRDESSVGYYQPRVESANQALQQAQAAQVAYLDTHPGAGNIGSTDPTYAALSAAVASAQAQFADADKSLTQAKQALATDQGSATSHVIDPPGDAVANSKKKTTIFAGAAGLTFGLLISLLGLIAFTAADTAARRREDVETTPGGLQVVATIAEFPKRRTREKEVSSR
jgi:hypothetical protein